jgi:hypothetical protein
MVTLNIITKDIKINSQNKVENQQYLIWLQD